MGTNPLAMAAFKPVIDTVTSQFAKAGRYGSGANQQALASALAPAALQAQQAAIQQAPQMQNLDLQQLARVGAPAKIRRRLFCRTTSTGSTLTRMWTQRSCATSWVSSAAERIGGSQIQPVFRKPAGWRSWRGALGGAQLGASAGINPMYGAIGGGLLGLM